MMYPIQCHAGFYVPVKAGKFTIRAFRAVKRDLTADSEIRLIDDKTLDTSDKYGRFLDSTYDLQPPIIHDKSLASTDGRIEGYLGEGVKTRGGLSAVKTSNLIAGEIQVWID